MRLLALLVLVLALRTTPMPTLYEDGGWRWGEATGCLPFALCADDS